MPEVKCAYDEMVPLKDLKMNPRNPNNHTTHQIKALARIINLQGWRAPITVSNRSGFVVRGHARLMSAKLLQCHEAPVDYQDYENEAEEWSDLVADNHIAELAEMNEDLLRMLMKDINEIGYDLELTGFDWGEIDELLANADQLNKSKDPGPKTDKAKDLWEKYRPEAGSVWQIGPHKLMCGDVTSMEDMAVLMENQKADLVFTDPPYNMDYKSKNLGGIENDRLGEAGFVRLILASTHNMTQALRQGGSYYICMSAAEYGMVIYQLRKLGYAGTPLVWVKPGTGLGAQEYRPQFEVILYGYTGSRSQRVWNGKRKETNLWSFDPDRGVIATKTRDGGMVLEFGLGFDSVSVLFDKCLDGTVIGGDAAASDLWQFGRESGDYIHPTQKPTPLVKRAIKNSSNKGDLIVDGFLGSGTTMAAAEETGRICYGMEKDKYFVAVVLERMSGMGLIPEKLNNIH